jgi:AcrR family transcriptional regulator
MATKPAVRNGKRRGRPPQTDGPSARERILHAGRELFNELGYQKASLTQIAERAGLTRPAVNHYFHTKEDLYSALFESARDAVVASGLKTATEAETLPARLSAFMEAATQVDAADRSYARFIAASLLDAFRHPELADQARSQLDDVRGFIELTLREAVAAGDIRADIDVPAVTEMLLAMMWGMGLYAGFVGTHEQLEAVVTQFSRLLEGDIW